MGNSALNSSLRHLKVSAKELDSKHDSIYQGAITVHSLTVLSKQQWPAEISRYYCGTIDSNLICIFKLLVRISWSHLRHAHTPTHTVTFRKSYSLRSGF